MTLPPIRNIPFAKPTGNSTQEPMRNPGGMHAGFEYFKNFERDGKDFAELGAKPLPMPVLVLTGEKASGTFLIEQTKLVATNMHGKATSLAVEDGRIVAVDDAGFQRGPNTVAIDL